MKLFALLILFVSAIRAVTCPAGTTHIVDNLTTGDGTTAAFGTILIKGPASPNGSVLSTTKTITIGAAGLVDFCLVGGIANKYTATYLLTNSTGKATNSYAETWIVPNTVIVQTVKALWGAGTAAPQGIVSGQQINGVGLAPGGVWVWNGTAWVPGIVGTVAVGLTGPTGFTGPAGAVGAVGAAGAAGPSGAPGPTGPIGPTGPSGSGGGSTGDGTWGAGPGGVSTWGGN